MKWLGLILIVSLLIFSAVLAADSAQLTVPAIFGDNMVLQQNFQAPVWGWAKPGSKVIVKTAWLEKKLVARADNTGKWQLKIATPKAGGPYWMEIKGDTTYRFENVMIGEVWLCSGQSNMEMPVDSVHGSFRGVPNYKMELATANYPLIRLFQFPRTAALKPQTRVYGQWQPCQPTTVANFSAVAYFFGRELFRRLRVPIGLIHTSWGGSAAEAWTRAEKLWQFDQFRDQLVQLDTCRATMKELDAKYQRELEAWKHLLDFKDGELQIIDQIAQNDFADPAWQVMSVPQKWSRTDLKGFTGVVWFGRTIDIPGEWAGKSLTIELGPIDEMDVTFFNGKKIGEHNRQNDWNKKRSYDIPGAIVKSGQNSLAIRVTNLYGEGGIFGKPQQLNLYLRGDASAKISLAGEWHYKVVVDQKQLPPQPQMFAARKNKTPALLYNGMLHPLIPYSIKGVIWYQGEANTYDAGLYSQLFPAMIANWREDWNQGAFPFYYVQIAPFQYNRKYPVCAELRDAQRKSLAVPNSGMVVTLDLGNKFDIHPRRKIEVGRRLALWALAKDYDFADVVYSGPLYKSMKIEGDKVRIFFDHVGAGLYCRGDHLTGFTIAGEDSLFVPAKAVIDDNTILVSSDQVAHPLAVRYGWQDTAEPNLFNIEGLPASSFRTDDWRRDAGRQEALPGKN